MSSTRASKPAARDTLTAVPAATKRAAKNAADPSRASHASSKDDPPAVTSPRAPSTRAATARSTSASRGAAAAARALAPAREGAAAPREAEVNAVSRGKYVYCIVRSTNALTFGPIGIGGEPADVYTFNWRDLAAVISDSPPGVQDPTRENVLAHQRVNETVMMEHTVLPMSFGTVFKTRDDIVEFLRSAYEAFADVLNKMENKLEFGLKVLWDRDAVVQELEHDDEDIRRLKSEIASQKGSTYFARMQYGRLVDAALQARSERYVAEIFDGLRDVAVAARSNKPIGDRMILNAAFLVSRPEEPAFDARVKALGARYDKLTFKYTGPWPPYNFVNIRLKLERA
jgi:Gas vesicle synthesis protein GvpL/GvpF